MRNTIYYIISYTPLEKYKKQLRLKFMINFDYNNDYSKLKVGITHLRQK